jgi:hypothetical protein
VSCEPGTKRSFTKLSDVGWGEVEETDGCSDSQDALQGPAVERVTSVTRLPATKLVGRYFHGRRVGTWTQYDPNTGAALGAFTLDDRGSGTEVVHDQLGHTRRGAVVEGRREGVWTYYDPDGTLVESDVWSRGELVRSTGRAPWDPPMVSVSDACPADGGAADDGCPEAGKGGHGGQSGDE